MRKWPDHQRNA